MKVKAAVLHEVGGPFRIETLELEQPREGEVLVRVSAVGVCHSDWHLVTGDSKHPMPVVPGHEGSGVVEALGPGVSGLQVGQKVALNWAPSCGSCFYCGIGRPSLCGTYVEPVWAGTMLDGSTRFSLDGKPVYHYSALACFAEAVVVPEVCCVPMPDGVPAEVSALIGCAVTTGVGSVLKTARVPAGTSVVVFGVGGVGLATVMGAVVAGASLIVAVDPSEERRAAALEFEATHAVSPDEDVLGLVRGLTGGRGADYAFEAVGLPPVQEQCLDVVRPAGTVVLSGLSPMGSATNFPGAILTRQEKTVTGSYYGTADAALDFPEYARLYLEGKLPLDRMISRRYRLEEINEAYADMLAGTTRRGVVVFD